MKLTAKQIQHLAILATGPMHDRAGGSPPGMNGNVLNALLAHGLVARTPGGSEAPLVTFRGKTFPAWAWKITGAGRDELAAAHSVADRVRDVQRLRAHIVNTSLGEHETAEDLAALGRIVVAGEAHDG